MSAEDQRRLEKVRRLARFMDEAVRVPGTSFRFGLDGLLGLVPVVGDIACATVSAYIIREACRMGIPKSLALHMILNVAGDVTAGAVPVVGDVLDVVWKANRKNVAMLEAWVEETYGAMPEIHATKADREGSVIDV